MTDMKTQWVGSVVEGKWQKTESEDQLIEFTYWATEKKRKKKKDQEGGINRAWGTYGPVTKDLPDGSPEKERQWGAEKIAKEIAVKNFPSLAKDISLQRKEAGQIPRERNRHKTITSENLGQRCCG